jgi:hypothetical protein
MRIPALIPILMATLWSVNAAAGVRLSDRQEDAGKQGDVLQYVVPAAALSLTFLLHKRADGADGADGAPLGFDSDDLLYLNGSPRHDLALAMVRAAIVTNALKYAVDERRPNGGGSSFPSGHTSFAFTGAEFIRKEYGWGWGVPAYAIASYVGWTRVEARAHYTHDVLAGAAIGILANHDWGEHDTRYGRLSLVGLGFELRFH